MSLFTLTPKPIPDDEAPFAPRKDLGDVPADLWVREMPWRAAG